MTAQQAQDNCYRIQSDPRLVALRERGDREKRIVAVLEGLVASTEPARQDPDNIGGWDTNPMMSVTHVDIVINNGEDLFTFIDLALNNLAARIAHKGKDRDFNSVLALVHGPVTGPGVSGYTVAVRYV